MPESHRCEFEARALWGVLAWPLLPVLAFAAALHLGARSGLLPKPRPALDTERTILVHQVDAARQTLPVEVLLAGDSSCLTGVSARRLGVALGKSTLNVATFSFLDLMAHARLLEEYNRHHATGPAAVVLLLHPEALRRIDSEPYFLRTLTNYIAGRDDSPGDTVTGWVSWLSGRELFHQRLLARAVPAPLTGAYGRRYGFSRDLERLLAASGGSAPDPEAEPLRGSNEFRLAATVEKSCGVFRSALRPGTRLFVGLTPVPARFAGDGFPVQQRQMLEQIGKWLRAEAVLDVLPATLPDAAFARSTHLKETEVDRYTDRVAAALRERL